MLSQFALHRPDTLVDALKLVDDDHVPYWGGTELLLAMRIGLLRPDALVDLKRVPELVGVRMEDADLVIGGGCTHGEIARDATVLGHASLLSDAERRVGNVRVRAQGTIGGNLCFAEPRSDVATVLIALDASVVLVSARGSRTVTVQDFVAGPYWTVREPDELLVKIRVPIPAPDGVYLKFQTAERPTVSIAATRDRTGGFRFVVGAVAEIPHVTDVADLADFDPEATAEQIEPIADLAGSVRYKRHVTAVHLRRAVDSLRRTQYLRRKQR